MSKIGLSINDYWLIIRKRKWIVIFSFLAVFLSTVFHVSTQSPVYRATCSIRVVERKSVADLITYMYTHTTYDVFSSISRVLLGRPIIEKVIFELGLADEKTSPKDLENKILSIQGSTFAESEDKKNIINISVENTDAVLAARTANAIANVYINFDISEKTEQGRNMRIFIEEQIVKAKEELVEAENNLKAFKDRGKGATGIAAAIKNNIITLEQQKMEFLKIYTDKYPDVVKINEQIELLKKELAALPQNELELERLTRDYEVADYSYRQLQTKLDVARLTEAEKVQDIRIVNSATVPRQPVRPKKNVAVGLALMVGIVLGVFIAFVVETLDTSIGTIDDIESLLHLPVLAVVPYMKSKRKREWSFKELITPIFSSKIDRRRTLEGVENMRDQLIISHNQKSTTTEAYRILRTNMRVDELIKSNQRILLLTSTVPSEGKSITAMNLAFVLSQDGYRTLLVDCDLRKASIHRVLGVDKEPGLTNILLGTSTPEVAIRNLIDMMIDDSFLKGALKSPGLDNFNFLTCGKIIVNPAELLDSSKLNELFSYLKTQYDFIVVDSPPVLPVPDTIILGTKIAEKLFLVYRSGHTSKLALLRAKEQLDMMKTVVPSGVILNSTSPESQIVSDYYHHYYHYKYYTEEDKT
ncbi:MAG: GNVR domain-containing protein [Candidatus Omnitrophota bacterium]